MTRERRKLAKGMEIQDIEGISCIVVFLHEKCIPFIANICVVDNWKWILTIIGRNH